MGFLFSKEKNTKKDKRPKEQLSDKDQAMLDVKRQRDRLLKYEKKMDATIERETQICKSLLKAGKKDKAKLTLRKKKYQQNLLEKARNQLLNVEQLIDNIEEAQMQQQVFDAMKVGNDLLTQINSQIDLDEVEKLMDDAAENIQFQQELNDLLSQDLTAADEEDVLKELAQIEQMEADEMALNMPDAPKKEIAASEDQDQDQEIEEEEPQPQQQQKKQVLVQ
eukprot:CAMPEP_0202695996 /NCGR_PEP_ID=MMETSP1385-20130828/9395_1 /ASSEMBLY_ACC=CAM_ASM_000861 /TAXON_ID=933848 /ORGANISM="Elphidium margaritaceum" /LENGTH=221 /DNA_ID=CAMNT_0049352087 /DNA_START=66 /DNA_END=731 /DNA_ORIENTATION=-